MAERSTSDDPGSASHPAGSPAPFMDAQSSRRRIYEIVLWRIQEQIASGRLQPGDRLPSEAELAASLGVGRPAVRDAIRVLEAMGTVSMHSGPEGGVRLAAVPSESLTHLISLHVMLSNFGIRDVVRARIALERESVRLAARQAAAYDRVLVEEHLRAMEDASTTLEEFNDLDTAFHLALVRATGNILLTELTTALRIAMRPTLLSALRAAPDFRAMAGRLAAEHRDIHRAVIDGRSDLAASRIEAHIDAVYRPRWTPDAPSPPSA